MRLRGAWQHAARTGLTRPNKDLVDDMQLVMLVSGCMSLVRRHVLAEGTQFVRIPEQQAEARLQSLAELQAGDISFCTPCRHRATGMKHAHYISCLR